MPEQGTALLNTKSMPKQYDTHVQALLVATLPRSEGTQETRLGSSRPAVIGSPMTLVIMELSFFGPLVALA